MKCEKVKELILTDYADGELSEFSRKELEAHLETCAPCRGFREEAQKMVFEPLRGSGHVQPPEELWQRIKGAILERTSESSLTGLGKRLRSAGLRERLQLTGRTRLQTVFTARKPLLAFATVMVLILAAGIFTGSLFVERAVLNTYMEEQVEFLAFLGNGDGQANGNGYAQEDIGIPMEDLFL